MAKITIDDRIIRILPDNWTQLKKKDVMKLVSLTLTCETAIEVRMNFFFHLTTLNRVMPFEDSFIHLETKAGESFSITREQLIDMITPLNFLFKEEGKTIVIASKLRKQLFPFFYLHKIRYIGPDDGLTNISFGEFIEAEKHYINYAKSKNTKHLDLLVSTIYRPEDKERKNPDDLRIPFHHKSVPVRSTIIHLMDPVLKFSILLFYEGCRLFVMDTFKNVFSGDSSGKPDKFGMAGVIEALTNNDPTKFDKVEETKLFNALISLEKQMERADEMKRKMEEKK